MSSTTPPASNTAYIYTYSRKARQSNWLAAGACFLVAAVMVAGMWYAERIVSEVGGWMLAAAACVALIGLLTLWWTRTWRLFLLPDAVELRTLYSTRRVPLANLAGFRVSWYGGQGQLLLIGHPGMKGLDVPLNFEADDTFNAWLEPIPNLDLADVLEVQRLVEQNSALGASPEARMATIQAGLKVAQALGWISIGLLLWCIFYPRPYWLVCSAAAAMPVLILIVFMRDRATYMFGDERMAAQVGLSGPLMLSLMALPYLGYLGNNVVNYVDLVLPVAVGAMVAGAVGLALTRDAPAWGMIFMLMLYPLGAVPIANEMFDKAPPHMTLATVQAKHVTTGKGAASYFTVTPWIAAATGDVMVQDSWYQETAVGSPICVLLYGGAMGVPWVRVRGPGKCAGSAPSVPPGQIRK